MTTFEYLLNFALVGLVIVQVRGITLTKVALLLPVVMTGWIISQILRSIPTAGNDLVLELGFAAAGCGLGVLAGMATAVRRTGAAALAKAGPVAALLWVAGVGSRLTFSLYAQHGGAATLQRFSMDHHITGGAAWGAGFALMALAEVASRTGVLYLKARRSGAVIERGGLAHRFAAA